MTESKERVEAKLKIDFSKLDGILSLNEIIEFDSIIEWELINS